MADVVHRQRDSHPWANPRNPQDWRCGLGIRRPEGHALRGHVGELHGQCSLRRHANSLTLENHSLDGPWWSEVVEGLEKPIVNQGWITVPGKPGLGVTLNEDV